MRIILKTITIFIIAFFIAIILACPIFDKSYSYSVDSKVNSNGEKVCYNNYYINNKNYKLKVPCNRSEFIKLEYRARAGQLDYNSYEYRLVNLNQLLIKKGLEPLYY